MRAWFSVRRSRIRPTSRHHRVTSAVEGLSLKEMADLGHRAVETGQIDTLRACLDAGVSPDALDPWGGESLLCHAIDVELDGHIQSGAALEVTATAFLLARGADPVSDIGRLGSARDLAESSGHWLAVELIRWSLRRV